MTKPLAIVSVPYLNALPLYVGLAKLLPETQITFRPPVDVARTLQSGQADLGLIPVSALLDDGMQDFVALSDLGICCLGEVLSVYLASKVAFEKIEEIYLDPESRTSSSLLQLILPHFLRQKVRYLPAHPGYEADIQGNRAGLLIGDRALLKRETFPFRLDLGKAWLEKMNLPFVFALWAIRKDRANERIVETLRLAASLGTQKIGEISKQWAKANDVEEAIARLYLEKHIHYYLGQKEHESLSRFVRSLSKNTNKQEITFYEPYPHYRPSFSGKENFAI